MEKHFSMILLLTNQIFINVQRYNNDSNPTVWLPSKRCSLDDQQLDECVVVWGVGSPVSKKNP